MVKSNQNANCVPENSRFKFVDDLTILEKITILCIGMTSFNMKQQVPNNILQTGLYIPNENLESQIHLDKIQEWTSNQQMVLNEEKPKV